MNRYSFTYDIITEDYFAVEAENVKEASEKFKEFFEKEYSSFLKLSNKDGRPRFYKIVHVGNE